MRDEQVEWHRRRLLQFLGAGGLLSAVPPVFGAEAFGKRPDGLPPGRSIYRLSGEVLIDGRTANEDTPIGADAHIQTAPDSELIFVVGQDAFIARGASEVQLRAEGGVFVHGLRVLTGALLSVFGKREHTIETLQATIGIRGTGVYVEAAADASYVCTCYGRTEIIAAQVPEQHESIVSHHHDAPRYILAEGAQRIQPAPFKNHSDAELALIEALVGRTPPFSFSMPGRPGSKGY